MVPGRTVVRLHQPSRPGATRNESGVALVMVVVVLAIVAVVIAEIGYGAHVDLASARNARDDLRAHYLARSALNLSRLLLKIQEKMIDPNRNFVGDLQILEYAPVLLGAFSGGAADSSGMAEMVGIDLQAAKGIGLEGGGTFTLDASSEDGKVNVNCGGALASQTQKDGLAVALALLFLPAEFNPIFEQPDAEGNHMDRAQMIQAIIDWTDFDETLYGTQESAPEDYRYESLRDPYPTKNQPFDTLEELHLVQGVGDEFMSRLKGSMTVWGGCGTVNVNEADALVLALLIIQYAREPDEFQSPQRILEALQLGSYAVTLRSLLFGMGITDVQQFIDFVQGPEQALGPLIALLPPGTLPPPPPGIAVDQRSLASAITVGKRRVWKLVASAEVGRVRKRIDAVWDAAKISLAGRGRGGYVYWREE